MILRPPRRVRPTIHDVARQAGVSSTTVSHVLNETRFVSDEARAKVLSAVEELGYRPDAAARGLRSRRRRIVGLLVTNPHNRGFASLMDGIDGVLAPAGYSLIVSATRGDPTKELACFHLLREQGIDGLILAGSAGAKEDDLFRLHEEGLPIVQINRATTTLPVDHVSLDYHAAGHDLASHLVGLGHRSFALLGTGWSHPVPHPFFEGWNDVLRAAGLPREASNLHHVVSREDVGYRVARVALAEAERPTALVSLNLPAAIGVLLACREIELSIPRQLSVATLGDASWAPLVSPPLTVIPDAPPEWGRRAASLLLDRVRGTYRGPPRREIHHSSLIVRESTSVAPAGSPRK